VSLVSAPADIKVSGIAWQDQRTASRVVVNGFLLREGDTVSRARIVEIFQNRVRFSSAAGTFEVYLVATGLPGPPK
jgi:general secretion pathway protein B